MSDIGEIAYIFISTRDQVKLYHWATTSYSRHIASDKFVVEMSIKMDQFMETIQGVRGKRLIMPQNNENPLNNQTDESIVTLLKAFSNWLTNPSGLPKYLQPNNTELFNIRDDMLSLVNQTLYLFSLH